VTVFSETKMQRVTKRESDYPHKPVVVDGVESDDPLCENRWIEKALIEAYENSPWSKQGRWDVLLETEERGDIVIDCSYNQVNLALNYGDMRCSTSIEGLLDGVPIRMSVLCGNHCDIHCRHEDPEKRIQFRNGRSSCVKVKSITFDVDSDHPYCDFNSVLKRLVDDFQSGESHVHSQISK